MKHDTFLAQAVYAAWLEGRAWGFNEEIRAVWLASRARSFLASVVLQDVLAKIDAGIDGTIPSYPAAPR